MSVWRGMAHDWGNEVVRVRHPRNYDYYWLVGDYTNTEPDAE